ncbi:type 1 fimbrial major subunit FimA [Acinetobacter bereziniae]|jgi:major type 1 subunit fimbrin (pilin)|uniref:type 1 fimbrial major subunit FimA n=1 Tax=Acinetobacter bereziniae TaxID=106648 RepID=UPI001250217E|nr:type 1 fimbrial major subunit FimA [Acinetobacter bereziniae]MCU4314321.1 type 1 fimbrial major subunit FimA [Acinetobacter bereziniae]
MKLSTLGLIAISTLGASASALAVEVKGGTVNFTGDLVNAACAVSTGSANQTVTLGQVRTANFKNAGDKTTPVPFEIKLVDCDPLIQATAAIAFQGTAVGGTAGANLLAVSAADANGTAAKNVGIEIADNTAKVLGLTGAVYSTAKTLVAGDNTLQFSARYVSTDKATSPGQANASATFTVKYE